MNRFRWWRRLRGGRWAAVTGWFWGRRWVRVSPSAFTGDAEVEDYNPPTTSHKTPLGVAVEVARGDTRPNDNVPHPY